MRGRRGELEGTLEPVLRRICVPPAALDEIFVRFGLTGKGGLVYRSYWLLSGKASMCPNLNPIKTTMIPPPRRTSRGTFRRLTMISSSHSTRSSYLAMEHLFL